MGGTLTLGDGSADTMSFAGGITHTAGATSIFGVLNTTDAAVSLGSLTLLGLTTIDSSTSASSGGTILIASLQGNKNLGLSAGIGTITVTGNVGDVTALGSGIGPALTISGSTGLATFQGTVSAASGLSVASPLQFMGDVSIGSGDTGTNFDADVTFAKASGPLVFEAGRSAVFGDSASDHLYLSGDSSSSVSISTTANAGSLTFNGAISGTQVLDLSANTSGRVVWNADLSLSGTTVGTNLSISAAGVDFASGVDVSTTDRDIAFLVDELILAGTNTVSAGLANFRLAPRLASASIEFAPTKALALDVFFDSDFSSVTAGSFILGSSSQTGDIHIGNASNGVTASYPLTVVQQQSGAGKIQFENGYTASNQNLSLSTGTGGLRFGNSAGAIAVSLGTGAFVSNGASGAGGVSLAQDAAITANGGISFLTANSTIDDVSSGSHSLTLTVGGTPSAGINLAGAIGATEPLASLSASVAGSIYGIAAKNATTSGSQTWSSSKGITLSGTSYISTGTSNADVLSFVGDVVYTSASGLSLETSATTVGADAISCSGKILASSDGLGPLAILPGSDGTMSLSGAIGSAGDYRPTNVTLGAIGNSGAYSINGSYSTSGFTDHSTGVTTVTGSAIALSGAGSIIFTGGVEQSAGLTMTTDGASGSDIHFGSFVRSSSTTAFALSLQAGSDGAGDDRRPRGRRAEPWFGLVDLVAFDQYRRRWSRGDQP